jgi:type IV secretory pathway VirB4 component
MVLADNLRVHPDVLIGNGNGVFGSGVQGSGKTSILVRILEQAAQFHVPMVIFDREGDILPAAERFPRGVIGTHDNCRGMARIRSQNSHICPRYILRSKNLSRSQKRGFLAALAEINWVDSGLRFPLMELCRNDFSFQRERY